MRFVRGAEVVGPLSLGLDSAGDKRCVSVPLFLSLPLYLSLSSVGVGVGVGGEKEEKEEKKSGGAGQ